MAAPVYLRHPSSLRHETGAHPERPARISAIERELERRDWLGLDLVEAPSVDDKVLAAVHPPEHVAAIRELCARGGGALDVDTVVSPGSYEAALHAAGGAVALVDILLAGADDGRPRAGFCGLRPPGHHAEAARAMGFCLFNNIAVAARHALRHHGLERVLIVDWDVHHGNGTNDIFHGDAGVLYVSLHQSPLYPGTGGVNDVGVGAGEGFTINLPLPPGSGDAEFCSLVEHVVAPVAREHRPQLLLISAGYDAHREDPLADCEVTEAGYAAMTTTLRQVAEEHDAPVGIVLEGGYALDALARSVAVTLESLCSPGATGAPRAPVHPLAAAAARRLSGSWPSLGVLAGDLPSGA
ncbi:MAG TPA: histone deacetylase [Solirubrobacteraceae bacterium]|nr:histone deacetylase [Solirubrobacteraceae bacterium]